MFSDAYSEGQSRDINEEFPTGSSTEVYDYLSDSDLEDECSCSEEEYTETPESGNPEPSPSSQAQDSDPQLPSIVPSERPPQSSPDAGEAQGDDRLASISLGLQRFWLTCISGLRMDHQGWEKLPSSATWRQYRM